MKKQLNALVEFLDDQFCDWSDIEYEFEDLEQNTCGSISVKVAIEREMYRTYFTQNFEVTQDLCILIETCESATESADSKWFWILIAPRLFPHNV